MTWYYVPGQGLVDDSAEGANIPLYGELALPDSSKITWGDPGVREVPLYTNRAQFGNAGPFPWMPGVSEGEWAPGLTSYAVGYIPGLVDQAAQAELGTLTPLEREQYEQMRQQALAIPTRDWTQLQAGYPGEGGDWRQYLTPSSPDAGAIMLQLRDRIMQGQATTQERGLYDTFLAQMREQDWRASTPQPSDAFSALGDQFFQALNALTMAVGGAGSFGAFGAAGAAGAGAGAGGSVLGIPTSTLATLGTVGGYGAQGAGMLGTALQQPWLTRLAGALGAASGLAGGVAGLGNLAASGVQNVSDVGRLLQSTGRVTGALGAIPGADPLRQAGRYLGLAGQVGRAGGGAGELFQTAQDVQAGATQGGAMDYDYSWDYGGGTPYDNWSWDAGATGAGGFDYSWDYGNGPQSMPYDNWSGGGALSGLSLEDQVRQAIAGRPDLFGTDVSTGAGGGGGWLSSVLGSLGQVGSFLGKNAGWLGPAVSGLAGLGAGALGSNAARDAAGAQTDALNRALELQTAQWLQQQANQAPWLEAGRQALPMLQQLAGQGQPPGLPWLAPMTAANYAQALPSATPGWTPQTAGQYLPGDTPSAAAYRYQPGQVPSAAGFRYTPGAVPTLSGQELLANDPGVQFRLDEGRRALEASAAARGGLVSGPTLAALQRQGQELSSQEYGQAWNRAAEQARLRESWAQQASQLGWTQAESEARLREQLAQVASQQGWTQALQENQQRAGEAYRGWQSGLTAAQWNQQQQEAWQNQLYQRQLAQAGLRREWDIGENQTAWDRLLQQYNSQTNAQTMQWNRLAGLAGLGTTATQQLASGGQNNANAMGNLLTALGQTQAGGVTTGASAWTNALGNLNTAIQSPLQQQQFQQQLATLLGALNR